MEVVLTPNLVSLETKNATTACNFQHDFMPWEAKQEAIHIYKYEAIHESNFMIAEM